MPFSPPPESLLRALFEAWYRDRKGTEPPRDAFEALPAAERAVFVEAGGKAWAALP